MKYINAADVLPKELLNEILNYVDGELLYKRYLKLCLWNRHMKKVFNL
ncbi:hypothetical protein [Clostridium diolis]|nr:hypothetical protein [Clostridium diolis]